MEGYLRWWKRVALPQSKVNSMPSFQLQSIPNSLAVLFEVQEIEVTSGAGICGGEIRPRPVPTHSDPKMLQEPATSLTPCVG